MAFEETIQKPFMSLSKKIAYSLIGGFIITLVTSIIPNNAAIGASNYGYIFPWLSQPLYPIGSPPTIIWESLLLDGLIWTVGVFVMIIIYQLIKTR